MFPLSLSANYCVDEEKLIFYLKYVGMDSSSFIQNEYPTQIKNRNPTNNLILYVFNLGSIT